MSNLFQFTKKFYATDEIGVYNKNSMITSNETVLDRRARQYELISLTSNSGQTDIDFTLGNFFKLVLTENTNLTYQAGATPGQSGSIYIIQDGTGGRTLTFDSIFLFPGGSVPSPTSAANSIDVLVYEILSSNQILCNYITDFK